MGSEMCIRDRPCHLAAQHRIHHEQFVRRLVRVVLEQPLDEIAGILQTWNVCLLYTSDAADEEDSVDFVGLRNIKKKKKKLFFFFFKQKTAYEM